MRFGIFGIAGVAMMVVGLILMGMAYAESIKEPVSVVALYDMNDDGVVNWKDLDVNNDGKVDIYDIVSVAVSYGSRKGDDTFNPRCDFNQDERIDDIDLNLIKEFYGYPLSIFDVGTLEGQAFVLGLALCVMGTVFMTLGITKKS